MPTKCKHRFIGLGTGVHCTLCGLDMTTPEYRAYLAEQDKPKRTASKRRKPQDTRKDETGANTREKEGNAL